MFGTSLALAAYAIEEMRRALAVGRPTVVGMTVLVLFAINFTWITLPLVTSVVGFLRVVARRRGAVPADRNLATLVVLCGVAITIIDGIRDRRC